MHFVDIIEYLGAFAFAISGIRLASAKSFDWFGAYVVGLVTAIGGGTLRDVLLGITPFWMSQPGYLVVTAAALLCVILFSRYLVRLNNTFFIFDTIGLGLFVVVGIERTLMEGYTFWVAITMGMITGSAGGIVRDILINEVPLIFRKDVYAMACVVGGIVFWVCSKIGLSNISIQLISAFAVILVRVLAVKFHISFPVLRGDENDHPDEMYK